MDPDTWHRACSDWHSEEREDNGPAGGPGAGVVGADTVPDGAWRKLA